MYKTDEDIMKRVHEHYDALKAIIPEERIVGIFLQGSQNYGLGYEGSDVDTKAIVLPSFEDIVLNHAPISTTHVLPNNEHIDIKDIRVMFDNFKKQNINFIEILFTKYQIVNPTYQSLFSPIIDNREKIARYNMYAALNCMCGMILEKQKALCHPYPTTAWKIEKWGYDGKQLQHCIRVNDFLQDYINNISYKKCLLAKNSAYQIDLKANKLPLSVDMAVNMADILVKESKKMKDEYMITHDNTVNIFVEELLIQTLTNILTFALSNELLNKNNIIREDC